MKCLGRFGDRWLKLVVLVILLFLLVVLVILAYTEGMLEPVWRPMCWSILGIAPVHFLSNNLEGFDRGNDDDSDHLNESASPPSLWNRLRRQRSPLDNQALDKRISAESERLAEMPVHWSAGCYLATQRCAAILPVEREQNLG